MEILLFQGSVLQQNTATVRSPSKLIMKMQHTVERMNIWQKFT